MSKENADWCGYNIVASDSRAESDARPLQQACDRDSDVLKNRGVLGWSEGRYVKSRESSTYSYPVDGRAAKSRSRTAPLERQGPICIGMQDVRFVLTQHRPYIIMAAMYDLRLTGRGKTGEL